MSLPVAPPGPAEKGPTEHPGPGPVGPSGRRPPQDLEAERAVLGALMLEPSTVPEIMVMVQPEAFYRRAHGLIFAAMQAQYERSEPLDEITIGSRLREAGHLEAAGGMAFLAELTTHVSTAANAIYHAQVIRDRALSRRLIEAATQIVAMGFEGLGSVEALADAAESRIFEVTQAREKRDFVPVREVVRDTFRLIQSFYERKDPITGLSSGFVDFDKITSGLQPADLIIVAGRPSMGKTAFALTLAQNVSVQAKQPAAVFSLEMSKEQLVMRLMCSEARIDSQRLRAGTTGEQDWPQLAKAAQVLNESPLYIDDTGSLSVLEMRAKARRLKAERGLCLVVVDYLQLMRGRSGQDGREREISEISRGLKALAKELNVPVVALSQLNRSLEQRADKRPMLSDLRESGAIEQDADVICFVYRDEYYNPDSEARGTAELIVGKQRNGPTGTVRLRFHRQYTRFDNLARAEL